MVKVALPTIDARTNRELILGMAGSSAALPEPHRRRAVMGLMRERYRSVLSAADPRVNELPCTEAEVFYAGYGDATGREYWSAWLFPGKATADQLAWLIAAHASRSAEEFERVRKQLAASLAAIAEQPVRAIVKHLVADPDTGRFVPTSLRAFLEVEQNAQPASATPATAPRRRGQRPMQRERVQAAMWAALEAGTDIFGMKEEALAAAFQASRTTCRDARKILEAERGTTKKSSFPA
jgi:hypothetical protein